MNIRRSAVTPASEAAETRVTFGTITPASWTKLSGRVIGIDPGDERNVAHDPIEAHFLRGLLEREGIDAEVRGEALFGLRPDIGIASDTLPAVWIIKDAQLKRALEFVANSERDKNKTNK